MFIVLMPVVQTESSRTPNSGRQSTGLAEVQNDAETPSRFRGYCHSSGLSNDLPLVQISIYCYPPEWFILPESNLWPQILLTITIDSDSVWPSFLGLV